MTPVDPAGTCDLVYPGDPAYSRRMGERRRAAKRSRDFFWERLRDRPMPGVRLVLGSGDRQAVAVDAVELLDGRLPQPDASLLYDLLSRSPLRRPGDHVRLAQVADELRAAGLGWQQVGIDPARVTASLEELARQGRLGGRRS
jgi:hypothetical protein